MCMRAVHWALHDAPMLTTEKGTNDAVARLTLVALADQAQGDPPISHASTAALEFMSGLERKAILKALSKLSRAGLIAPAGKRGKTRVWRLDLSQKRPASDLEEVEREVELERVRARVQARDRMRRLRNVRSPGGTEHRSPFGTSGVPNIASVRSPARTEHGPVRSLPSTEQGACSVPLRGEHERATPLSREKELNKEPPSIPPQPDDGLLPLAALAETDAPTARRRQAPIGAEPDAALAFAEFWAVYPRRVGKKDAEQKFVKAVKDGADPAEIIAGAKRYSDFRAGQDPKFTKHPGTWLNQGCWADEYPEPRGLTLAQGHRPFKNPDDQSVYYEEF